MPPSSPRGPYEYLLLGVAVGVVTSVTLQHILEYLRSPSKQRLATLQDYCIAAGTSQRIPKSAWDYYNSGAGDQVTQTRNESVLRDRVFLRPRVLVDVTAVSTSHTLLGKPTSQPYGIAPTAFHGMAHAEAECATAAAAAASGVVYCLSSSSSKKMEEVVTAAPTGRRLWQLYYLVSREENLANIARAKALGMEAIVLTVDRPVLGMRDANLRNSLTLPGRNPKDPNAAAASNPHNLGHISSALNWTDVEWLVGVAAPLPVVLKGVFTREDGVRAVQAGVGGVWVSNHGGRQLDGVASSCEALVEVLKGVREEEEKRGGREKLVEGKGAAATATTPTPTPPTPIPVWVDGGVRRGVDVVKLLALGAEFVWVGKPILWGLVVGGREGVEGVLNALGEEVKNALQLMGVNRVGDLSRDHVKIDF